MNKVGKQFIEKTKYQNLSESDQTKHLSQPPLEVPYTGVEKLIPLTDPKHIKVKSMDLRTAIENRKSTRQYLDTPLTLDELSFLLWCTQGVKETIQNPKTGRSATFRTVPSAGARHAFETYLLINKVEGLKPGLYRYLAMQQKLAIVNTSPDIADEVVAACTGQSFIGKSAVTFIWAAVPYRMEWRYVERGYRYLYLDAGHVCQSLFLAAEAIDSGVCPIGAFSDDDINKVLCLDDNQFVIYAATVGKK
jgi:SagB-type dehydrogenase family enzyme